MDSLAREDGANVLLLATPERTHTGVACADLLAGDDPSETAILSICTRSIDDRLEFWKRHVGKSPAAVAIVAVGEDAREATEALGRDATRDLNSLDVLEDPRDLTTLGVRCTERLESLRSHERIALCLHTLTDLVHAVDDRTLYRFLSEITGQIRGTNAHAHYHLSPTAHDKATTDTFATLFDVVCSRSDGTWRVESVGTRS